MHLTYALKTQENSPTLKQESNPASAVYILDVVSPSESIQGRFLADKAAKDQLLRYWLNILHQSN